MKKLLILMLVLGLASTANAAIVLSLDGSTDIDEISIDVSDTVVVDIYNTDGKGYLAYLDFYYTSDGSYALSNATLTANAGDLSGFVGPYDGGYDNDEYEVTLNNAVGDSTPGSQFEVDLHCEKENLDVLIELWKCVGTTYTLEDTATIHQLPEPMTIALLGLGGLFLRRRR